MFRVPKSPLKSGELQDPDGREVTCIHTDYKYRDHGSAAVKKGDQNGASQHIRLRAVELGKGANEYADCPLCTTFFPPAPVALTT